MLKPTRIYTQEVLPNLHKIKRCAHVTGGGIIRAMKRLLPEGRQFNIEVNPPPIYDDFNMSDKDLMSTFNCGYGMLIITNTLDLDIPDMELIGEVC
jgi:phosphoribosylformylglycinamidine cyclo-ligase